MRVLCFGDSNTFGYDPRSFLGERYPAQSRWVDILAAKSGWEVLNRGRNGREIPRRANELEQAGRTLAANAPVDVLVVMLGTNDLLQGASALEACTRMEALLTSVRHLCGKVLLVAPPSMKPGEWVAEDSLITDAVQLAQGFKTLAERLGVSFADAAEWNVAIAYDGVHFTEEGHRAFAEGIYDVLQNI